MKHRARLAPHVMSLGAAALTALPLTIAACAGPPLTSPIAGEPVCADFEVGAGHTKMTGGLRYPVLLQIKNGSTLSFKTTLVGLRSEKDLASRILLSDDDETFTVEWAQCENERAPKAIEPAGRAPKGIAQYECGNAVTYKTEQLTTKKGDPKSHTLTFPAPPNAACWESIAAPESADAGAADAGEADGGTTDADAGTMEADGGTTDADGGTTDAGATGAGDAGATDAGKGASTSN